MYVKRDISILRDIFALSPVTDNIFQEHPRTGAFPTLTNVVITSEVFGVPPNAVQERVFGWQPNIFQRFQGRPLMASETGARESSKSGLAASSRKQRSPSPNQPSRSWRIPV